MKNRSSRYGALRSLGCRNCGCMDCMNGCGSAVTDMPCARTCAGEKLYYDGPCGSCADVCGCCSCGCGNCCNTCSNTCGSSNKGCTTCGNGNCSNNSCTTCGNGNCSNNSCTTCGSGNCSSNGCTSCGSGNCSSNGCTSCGSSNNSCNCSDKCGYGAYQHREDSCNDCCASPTLYGAVAAYQRAGGESCHHSGSCGEEYTRYGGCGSRSGSCMAEYAVRAGCSECGGLRFDCLSGENNLFSSCRRGIRINSCGRYTARCSFDNCCSTNGRRFITINGKELQGARCSGTDHECGATFTAQEGDVIAVAGDFPVYGDGGVGTIMLIRND